MIEQAVILAGGKGTRLGALAERRPKALVELAGKPLLEHQLAVAQRYGIKRVLILTGHLGEELAAEIGDGQRFGLQITYQRESAPLGTAGSLKQAEALLDENFFVLYGDIIFDIDLARVAQFHAAHGVVATLVVHPNDHPFDSDVVETDASGRVTAFHTKTREPERLVPNLVNAGIYLLQRRCADFIMAGQFADFGLDIFPRMLAASEPLAGYNTPEYAKDVGTPGRRSAVEADVIKGKVARRNIGFAQQAVFLDRDGVLIEERGDAVKQDGVALLPGSADGVGRIIRSDFLAVVATNQPGIAKGFLSEADVADAHKRVDALLGAEHAYVHGYYVCPHHPQGGFVGERPELKIACDCRKPAPGLLLQAAAQFNIDLGRSFIVGDRTPDFGAGEAAGVCTIGVRTGFGAQDGILPLEPDFMCADLAEAAELILTHQHLIGPARELASAVAGQSVTVSGWAAEVFARLLRWQLRRLGRQVRIVTGDQEADTGVSASATILVADDGTVPAGFASVFVADEGTNAVVTTAAEFTIRGGVLHRG
ncbi:MAG: histidinol-phosphate phosphatase family protein [Devosia sp.]|nr:histidinol-phosphate phosphatase family protein [Devosia sp.]